MSAALERNEWVVDGTRFVEVRGPGGVVFFIGDKRVDPAAWRKMLADARLCDPRAMVQCLVKQEAAR